MTDLTALRAIQERLAQATGPDREMDAVIYLVLKADDRAGCLEKPNGRYDGEFFDTVEWDWREAPHLTASIDAALALTERLLPECEWSISRVDCTSLGMVRPIWFSASVRGGSCPERGETPALAILRALVAALIAKSED